MRGHTDLGYMCLDTMRGRYRLIREDIGTDAAMKAKGMRFTTESYEIEGIGHLCILRMKAFAGLMKMETAVIATRDKDMPLLNMDWVSAFGKETQIIELYDVQLEHFLSDKLNAFAEIKDRDADIPEYSSGEHWYDEILYPCSYGKRSKGVSERFSYAAKSYLKLFLEQMDDAPECDRTAKNAKIRDYAEKLFSQGGPAVNQITGLFGEEFAHRLIVEHMYGAK